MTKKTKQKSGGKRRKTKKGSLQLKFQTLQKWLKNVISVKKNGKISPAKLCLRLGTFFLLIFTTSCAGLFLLTEDVSWLASKNPTTTALIKARNVSRKNNGKPPIKIKHWTKYGFLPRHLIQAVRIAEDDAFFNHNGFDFRQIKIAVGDAATKKSKLRGASTITQQTAKNLFLAENRSLFRKLQEAVLTIKLERALSKKRILEIYLNIIEFGDGIFGIEAAAQHYFKKHIKSLTADESAFLAALIHRPLYYEKHRDSGYFIFRQDIIIERMNAYGYLK